MIRLSVACTVDADIAAKIRRSDPGQTRARYDISVIDALRRNYRHVEIVAAFAGGLATLDSLARLRPDVVFNLAFSAQPLEAAFAGCLEILGLPYTGSGPRGIMLTNDKILSRRMLHAARLDVPRFVKLAPGDPIVLNLSPPLIVKPTTLASSAGIYADSVLQTTRGVSRLVRRIWHRFGVPAVCEEFIVGREFRIGVIESSAKRFRVVGISEWRFGKANPGWGIKTEAIRINPTVRRARGVTRSLAKIPRGLAAALAMTARRSVSALDVRGYATVDVRMDARGRIVVLEANSNPGLWSRSAIWSNPNFDANIRQIVRCALARNFD
jgi:D-alanine-D-alanine ligase